MVGVDQDVQVLLVKQEKFVLILLCWFGLAKGLGAVSVAVLTVNKNWIYKGPEQFISFVITCKRCLCPWKGFRIDDHLSPCAGNFLCKVGCHWLPLWPVCALHSGWFLALVFTRATVSLPAKGLSSQLTSSLSWCLGLFLPRCWIWHFLLLEFHDIL